MKAITTSKPLPPKKRRPYLILGTFGLFSGFVWLTLSLLDENINYFKTPSSLTIADRQAGKSTRLGGIVVAGSINQREHDIVFILTDGTLREKIHFNGVLPDLFRDEQGVVVDGHFDINGIFIASRILAKHDENYMSGEILGSSERSYRLPSDAP